MPEASNPPENTRPIILLIAEDADLHSTLKRNLRRDGYSVLLALDMEDALEWMSGGYVHADLVLVDFVGKSTEESLSAGRVARQHAASNGPTPLVVMAEKYGKDVEGTDVNVEGNDWVHYLGEEPRQLENLLARLTAKAV